MIMVVEDNDDEPSGTICDSSLSWDKPQHRTWYIRECDFPCHDDVIIRLCEDDVIVDQGNVVTS